MLPSGHGRLLARASVSRPPTHIKPGEGQVVNLSKLAFRTAGAAFVAVWLSTLAMTSLDFSSVEDLRDAAFEAHEEELVKNCRSHMMRKRSEEQHARAQDVNCDRARKTDEPLSTASRGLNTEREK